MDNPQLIYEGPDASYLSKPRAPLILLHDGGGTTFSYHCLNPINRSLYGIQNAHLDAGGYWDGGIPEMAAHYISLIESVVPRGSEILLGGWSLGGLLSLEVAHQLAARKQAKGRDGARDITVIGMVWIDSIYPKKLSEFRDMPDPEKGPVQKSESELKEMKLKEKVALNMTHARMMVMKWPLPTWKGCEDAVPPTILMRAKELVVHKEENGKVENDDQENEVGGEKKENGKSFVDYTREFRMLGWDEYTKERASFIKQVVDIEGHHFSIFHEDHLDDITAKIEAAADWLDPPEF
ncbi:Alpha/Beta hydrolase protein [Xylariaceae sp. FL0016]|nr:Alpha/Beta hydrolase protein [Xylariaceae sp. FL0016]